MLVSLFVFVVVFLQCHVVTLLCSHVKHTKFHCIINTTSFYLNRVYIITHKIYLHAYLTIINNDTCMKFEKITLFYIIH